MKKDLRRIENTLQQLTKTAPAATATAQTEPSKRTISFDLHAKPPQTAPTHVLSADAAPTITDTQPSPSAKGASSEGHSATRNHEAAASTETKNLNLPKLKTPSFSSHRNAANPALASSLLQDMQTIVEGWQADLNQVLREIQDLYLEGPIVDGWLESYSGEPITDVSTLRHAEVDRLMNYIEEICATPIPGSNAAPRTGYRLCGLNADGQMWSCPCPADQIPSLSLAIARHHKLRQLLTRKQELELRLTQLAETLVGLHSRMKG